MLLTNLNGTRYLQWTMGTDHFLKKGAKMEVFLTEDYSRRAPGTIAIAGIDGTDVARAEFITTAGQRVAGTVEAGNLRVGDVGRGTPSAYGSLGGGTSPELDISLDI